MGHWRGLGVRILVFAALALAGPARLAAEPVAVRFPEVALRRDLVLRGRVGAVIANGQLLQSVEGDVVTTRVVLRFPDGSLHDETVIFSQRESFRLVSDRLVQHGPAFPRDIDLAIDRASGLAAVRYRDGDRTRVVEKRFDLPADLANGMLPMLLRNVRPEAPPSSLSLVVATPAPRVVRLAIVPGGTERIASAGVSRPVIHYVLKVEIGGLSGLLAPLFGKQPPDSHVWIADGDQPAFVRSEQPFYVGGPLWRIEVLEPR